jgi:hypothetical protein
MERYHYGQLRFWEMLPGLVVWGTFLLALTLSFLAPLWVIIFIIVFDLLWLYRVIYFNLFVVIAWMTYRKTIKIDWKQKLIGVPGAETKTHLVFLPTYKEGYEIIETTLLSLQKNSFPVDRMMVVLGGEEGDRVHFEEVLKSSSQHFIQKGCRARCLEKDPI